jgi:aldehyde:ferredoxin oxidoreductase
MRLSLFGYAGKILRMDLSTSRVEEKPLSEDYARKFMGGRGLGAKLLWDEVKAGTLNILSEHIPEVCAKH